LIIAGGARLATGDGRYLKPRGRFFAILKLNTRDADNLLIMTTPLFRMLSHKKPTGVQTSFQVADSAYKLPHFLYQKRFIFVDGPAPTSCNA
jgi:hypothetical protein